VANTDYWVEISQQGVRLGAGFLLTRHHVLTAFHCLRVISSDDEPLDISFASGEVASGRICERAQGADLALIDILKPREKTFILPSADRAVHGDRWFAPYRPSTSDPCLSGDVVSGNFEYRCDAGHVIEALQLGCSQHLGDYSGYSGGPVERHVTAGQSALLGVLLEQYPDRKEVERASDVLFAATIAEALRCFDSLGVAHLLKVLSTDNEAPEKYPAPSTSRQSDTPSPVQALRDLSSPGSASSLGSLIAAAGSVLHALHEWANSGVLDPMYVSELKRQVARRVVESDWTDDA
jgi:hypothetical protein